MAAEAPEPAGSPKFEWGDLIEAIPTPVIALDREWRCRAVNRALERLAGRQREDLIGRLVTELPETRSAAHLPDAGARALVGGLAHDLNNLLTTITAYTEFLLYSLAPTDKGREDAQEIKRAAALGAELAGRLMSFARAEEPDRKLAGVDDVVRETVKLLPILLDSDVNIEQRLGAPGFMIADPARLEQVIVDLLMASDTMRRPGTMTFETQVARIDGAGDPQRPGVAPGEYALLAIQDTRFKMDAAARAIPLEKAETMKTIETELIASTADTLRQAGGLVFVDQSPEHGRRWWLYLPRMGASGVEGQG